MSRYQGLYQNDQIDYTPSLRAWGFTPTSPNRELTLEVFNANYLEAMKKLFQADPDLYKIFTYERSPSVLHVVIDKQRRDIFDYMMTRSNSYPFEVQDNYLRTPLLFALSQNEIPEYYSLELLKIGAKVNLQDRDRNSALHYSIQRRLSAVTKSLIDRGADVNLLNFQGESPLHLACQFGTVEEVAMLVCNGADCLELTRGEKNITPLDGAFKRANYVDAEKPEAFAIQEFLYPFIFDEECDYKVDLKTLIAVYQSETPLLTNFVDRVMTVIYTKSCKLRLCLELLTMTHKQFILFHKKFPMVIKDILESCSMFKIKINRELRSNFEAHFLQNLEFMLSIADLRLLVLDFVGNLNILLKLSKQITGVSKSTLTEDLIAVLLSYGMPVYEAEMYEVFVVFGRFSVFNTMLYLDIKEGYDNTPREYTSRPGLQKVYHGNSKYINSPMPRLLCDVVLTSNKFLALENYKGFNNFNNLVLGLDYFAAPKYKSLTLRYTKNRNNCDKRLKQMPQPASLKELAREAAKEFVIEKFKCKNTKELFCTIQRLPIGNDNIRIMLYEKALY